MWCKLQSARLPVVHFCLVVGGGPRFDCVTTDDLNQDTTSLDVRWRNSPSDEWKRGTLANAGSGRQWKVTLDEGGEHEVALGTLADETNEWKKSGSGIRDVGEADVFELFDPNQIQKLHSDEPDNLHVLMQELASQPVPPLQQIEGYRRASMLARDILGAQLGSGDNGPGSDVARARAAFEQLARRRTDLVTRVQRLPDENVQLSQEQLTLLLQELHYIAASTHHPCNPLVSALCPV